MAEDESGIRFVVSIAGFGDDEERYQGLRAFIAERFHVAFRWDLGKDYKIQPTTLDLEPGRIVVTLEPVEDRRSVPRPSLVAEWVFGWAERSDFKWPIEVRSAFTGYIGKSVA